MKQGYIVVLSAVLITGTVLLGGCATDLVSIGVTDTPIPEVVDYSGRETPAVQAPVTTTTVKHSGIVSPAPTLSAACQDLLAATDDDKAFMKAMTDKNVYAGICSLTNDECTIGAATEISQVISTSPKPKTPLLVQARKQLLSASTYCFDPADSASRNRTRDDLDTYVSRMSEYAFLVSSCPDQTGGDIIASLKKPMEKQAETLFRGTGNDVQSFFVRGYGNSTFFLSYSGNGNFVVMLQDTRIKNVDLLANSAGTYKGKKSLPLDKGRYSVNVTASGPWSIIVTSPE